MRSGAARVGVAMVLLAIAWPVGGATQAIGPDMIAASALSAVPPAPTEFLAPQDDPAGRAARAIARRVPRFPNLRAFHPAGQWRHDPNAVWSVRPQAECLAELSALGIEHDLVRTRRAVPTPVNVRSAIAGVRYFKLYHHAPFIVSCELATRMVHLSEVLRGHAVASVDVMSTWRTEPATSFHTMGLALDIASFTLDDGSVLTVADDFGATPGQPTCPAPEDADTLRQIACELEATGRFSTVITPNYSEGHRDHFHVDVRPDDPRVFVR